jgi:hypothetical protein
VNTASVRKNILAFLLLVVAITALGLTEWSEPSVDEQVKYLAQRYSDIEAQLDRSIHYTLTTNEDGVTRLEQAWLNGANDPIKISIDQTGPSGRQLTEYFADDLQHPYSPGMFVLHRKETLRPDGATDVEETRQYFGTKDGESGELLRELRKKAHLKAGETLDTVRTPGVVIDPAKQPKDDRTDVEQADARDKIFSEPQKIVAELKKAGPPASDPFSAAKGDSDKFRVIHGTVSPDGRYAIALGLARKSINWEEFRDKEFEESSAADEKTEKIYTAREEDRQNYVVNLTTGRILGTTGCNYFGTKRGYYLDQCAVAWSPDSKTFVQVTSEGTKGMIRKWNYNCCRAGKISETEELVGTVDLGKYAEKAARGFLARHKGGKFTGSIAISASDVSNDPVIALEVVGSKRDINFSVAESIRLRETPAGLRLETINVRNTHVDPDLFFELH